MPTKDCLTTDPRTGDGIFKLQNLCRGRGIVAVFDLNEEDKSVSGCICPEEIPGLTGEEFAVYEHFSQNLHILTAGEKLPVVLKNGDDFRLYIITPMKNGSCVIGDGRKFISPAALTEDERLIEPGLLLRVENKMLIQEEIL